MSSQRLLIIGAILGLVTVVLLNMYVGGIQEAQESVKVLRLRPDVSLAKGQPVTQDQLMAVGLPEDFADVVQQAIPATNDASRWIQDRPVTADVTAGSVLLYDHFEDAPEQRFSATIKKGMRAMSLPVKHASAVSYLIEPGSRVDILGTIRDIVEISPPTQPGTAPKIQQPRISTKTILQNVRVLAVGRATSRGAYLGIQRGEFKDVTVEVTPLDAEKLAFALEHTEPRRELTLVLRNPADDQEARIPSVDWSDLNGSR